MKIKSKPKPKPRREAVRVLIGSILLVTES